MENTNNYKKVNLVLWGILFLNFFVAILKVLIGTTIDSNSIVADGFHSMSDGTSNIVGIIGVWLASRPIDKDHPYGHSKFEVVTGLFIGLMLLVLGGNIIFDSIEVFKNPVIPDVTVASLIAILITLFINIFVCVFEYSVGKKLDSHILMSDALHTRSDIFITVGVLLGLVGIKLGLPVVIDPIISLVVACFILHSAYEIFKSTIDVLVDKAVVDVEDIRKVLDSYSEILCYHDIRSRGSKSNIHIDMHIMFDPTTNIDKAHKLSHDIEDDIREITNKNTQVIIHIEPYYGYCRV